MCAQNCYQIYLFDLYNWIKSFLLELGCVTNFTDYWSFMYFELTRMSCICNTTNHSKVQDEAITV